MKLRTVSGVAISFLAVGIMLLIFGIGTSRSAPTFLGLGLLALGCVGSVVTAMLRVERTLKRSTSSTRKLIEDNHKRASEWDWRLTERLAESGTIQPRPISAPKTHAAPGSKKSSWKAHPEAGQLLTSGLFDPDYYAAFAGAVFSKYQDAASHYLSIGAPKMIDPNPFVTVARLPENVRAGLRKGEVRRLLNYMSSPAIFEQELSSALDGRVLKDYPFGLQQTGGPVAEYLSNIDDETLLAVDSSQINYGSGAMSVRARMIEHAIEYHDARRLSGPRESSVWDEKAESAWLAELQRTQSGLDPDLVSIIMPVLDRRVQVISAIRSIQNQTYSTWELIVVDDGSTDGTLEVLLAEASADGRIRVVENVGQGVSAARNTGINRASNPYLAFLDSDNAWRSNFLETMLLGMRRGQLEAAYSATSIHRIDEGATTYRAFAGGLRHLMILNHIDLNVLVVSRARALDAGGFDETMRRWVDHDFAIRIAKLVEPTLLPFIGCEYDDSKHSADRITVRESEHWQWAALGRNWVDWNRARTVERVAGRISVVVPTYNDHVMTTRAVSAILNHRGEVDTEIIIVDNGSNLETGQALLRAVGTHRTVKYMRLPRNLNFAIGSNFGAANSTGEFILFLNNDTILRPGALELMLERLTSNPEVRGVQPLLLYPDETIQTAGTVFVARDSLPTHLLVGHPAADAEQVAGYRFDVVTAATLLMRAREVLDLEGFDPIYVNGMEDVDLCLRATREFSGWFEVEPQALVTHFESKTPGRNKNVTENRRIFMSRWAGYLPDPNFGAFDRTGFEISHIGSDLAPVPAPRPLITRKSTGAQRWALKISSIGGLQGDRWGDTHFADSLASSLRALGKDVVIYRHGAHDVAATVFDDVVVSLRGLDRVRPMPGKVNILWVISHPELVSADEICEFDIVFAASVPWSERMSLETGTVVRPLLQATDVTRFNTSGASKTKHGGVFVGGTHPGRVRKIVADYMAAGLPLSVYGPGWADSLPDGTLVDHYVDNAELCGIYRAGEWVLADHWDDMAEQGFIQNRLFDAVASGCRVISDPVAGVDELFGGAVQTYSSVDDLVDLSASQQESSFPSDREMLRIAASVQREHSFERRAEQLVAAADMID